MTRTVSLHRTSLCGFRPTNEDVEKYRINLSEYGNAIDENCAPIDFFVVCDGHGGSEVSKFVAPRLERFFMNPKLVYPLPNNIIYKIYNNIQKLLINHPKKIANNCGCTAIVVIRYADADNKKHIQVINIGDCRAVLSRKGLAIPLSKDHKPIWPDEKKRIDSVNNKNGTNEKIHYDSGDWRIGDLSVSRSFGDLDNTPFVSHIPDSYCHQLGQDDEFIIIACDGLWDVLQNHEAVNFVRDHLNNNHIEFYKIPQKYPTNNDDNQNIARKLGDYAIAKGSTDNVSILIVLLK